MSQKVYILKDTNNGHFKIGFTTSDPKYRLKACQTGNPNEIVLLHWFYGSEELEKDLHKKFESYRLKGEWFKLTQKQVNGIIKEYPNDNLESIGEKRKQPEKEEAGYIRRPYIPSQIQKHMVKDYQRMQRIREFENDDRQYKKNYPTLSSFIDSQRVSSLLDEEKQNLENILHELSKRLAIEIANCKVEVSGLDYTENFFVSHQDPQDIDTLNVEDGEYETKVSLTKKKWCKSPPEFRTTKLYDIQTELKIDVHIFRDMDIAKHAIDLLREENRILNKRISELESQGDNNVKEKLKEILQSL